MSKPSLLVGRLDEWLFSPSRWLAIDAGNQPVAGVAIPSLQAGLEVVGKGRVAAIVGRLRAGVLAVDVDVAGDYGHFVTGEVVGWAAQRGLWHLVRPSGGADGHHHVFVAAGEHAQALSAYAVALRTDLGLRKVQVDVRTAVRPLSSPHRHGGLTRPRGDLREALRGLQRVFPAAPVLEVGSGRRKATTSAASVTESAGSNVIPLVWHRWKRQLAPGWRQYLSTGQPPTGPWTGSATVDRSLVEASLTRDLVWAVGDPQVAWQLIRASHPSAMTKAKHRGWDWWVLHVWNSAVRGAADLAPAVDQTRAEEPGAEVRAAVAAARERLEALMWTQSPRSRPALLLVGHHVLDRMERTGLLRVPCPERDLLLDTGISDRKTIRAALRLMAGAVGDLHTDCLSGRDRDSSSFEFEVAVVQGCSEIPPPRFHPPRATPGLWATLPRSCHSLWRALLQTSSPTSPTALATKAGLVPDRAHVPTRSTLAVVKKALVALAHAGLVRVDEHGRWAATPGAASRPVQERADRAYAELQQRVESERTAYRAGRCSTWSVQQAAALKAQRAKEKAWWNNLPPLVREARRRARREAFDALTISEQAASKARWAEARRRAGEDEVEHHQRWIEGLTPDQYVQRIHERKARFSTLSPSERGLAIAAWTRHRSRYLVPTGAGRPVPPHVDLAPRDAPERDMDQLMLAIDTRQTA